MAIVVTKLSLEKIKKQTLEQVISAQLPHTFPIEFSLNSKELYVDSACQLSIESDEKKTIAESPSNSNITLVVFSNITIKILSDLFSFVALNANNISAINTRNNLTSYRINVTVENLSASRQLLSEFALQQNIECALLENSPSLATPGLLVMDMDSTTIEIECIDEIAALAGVGEEVAEVTELAMQGKLDFAQSLHQRVATLKNAPEKILADVAKNIPLMAGLETLVKELKEHNWRVAIASGGFTYFADHLKALLELDAAYANVLEIKDATLTGKVLGSVVDAQVKAECLLALSKEYGIPHAQTVAMGDGANDLIMMEAAHLGVAFHAKPIVQKQAATSINHSGLDCLLHWLA